MKLSLKNLKSALDYSTERRTVDDLVRSGTRSVRVISESQVVRLIEAIVEDTLAASGHVDPAERDRVVAAAKARFDSVMQQQAETEARNKRQEETILSFQQRITQLVNEKQQLTVAQRQLEQKLDAALRGVAPVVQQPATVVTIDRNPEELTRLAEGLALLQGKLDAALRGAAPVVVQPAAVASVERNPEEMARLAEGMVQLQQVISRMDAKGSNTAADLDARMEQSMQKLIDRFGRTVSNATAKPTENRVEATDALIGRMLDGDAGTMSNIGDLNVEERHAEGDIQRSLDRLRRAQKKGAPAPAPNGTKDQTATDDRRQDAPDRRTDPPATKDASPERRKGSEDRRSP